MPSVAVTFFVERKCLKIKSPSHHCKEKEIKNKGTRCVGSVHQCPLCRYEFSPSDICKLCVDGDASSSTTVTSPVDKQDDKQVQRLLDDIAMIANRGATVEEMERVIGQCNAYRNTQSDSIPVRDRLIPRHGSVHKPTSCSLQHTLLRISYLFLSTLLQAQRKLLMQANRLSELTSARDEIRDGLTLELEAARLQYRNSGQARCNERTRALRNEEALRAHYDEINACWRRSR